MVTTTPTTAAGDLAKRASRWLDRLPLKDRWHLSAATATVARLATSAYVDREMYFAGPAGEPEGSGLSGEGIAARVGHRVTIVRLAARNSGRERPVVLFDHDNGKANILGGNFAPLLRTRFEGMVLLAGFTLAAGCLLTGLWLLKTFPKGRRGHPAMPFFLAGSMMIPLGVVFTGKRRQRLRRTLEAACRDIAEQLRSRGTLIDTDVSVALPAEDASPPAA